MPHPPTAPLLLAGAALLAMAGPARAQTAEEAARFVFEHATLNQGTPAAFNPDGRKLEVRFAAPCEIRLTRNIALGDVRVGTAEEINPRPWTESATIRLGKVLLRTGKVERDRVEQNTLSTFVFDGDADAVLTHSLRLVERTDSSGRWISPEGYQDFAWPGLRFRLSTPAEDAGRFKAAFEYLIGRFCPGKSSAY